MDFTSFSFNSNDTTTTNLLAQTYNMNEMIKVQQAEQIILKIETWQIYREKQKLVTRMYLLSGDTSTTSGSSNFTLSNQQLEEFISPHQKKKRSKPREEENQINQIKGSENASQATEQESIILPNRNWSLKNSTFSKIKAENLRTPICRIQLINQSNSNKKNTVLRRIQLIRGNKFKNPKNSVNRQGGMERRKAAGNQLRVNNLSTKLLLSR